MPQVTWWKANDKEKRRSLLRWSRKPKQAPEPPLRITMRESQPSPVYLIPCTGDVVPVRWLLQEDLTCPDPVTSVSLMSVTGDKGGTGETPSRVQPPAKGSTTRLFERGHQTENGPSLAERLRILLAVPLESLLPGPNTVLEWPGELMPFQRDGVRTLLSRARLLLADDMGLGKTLQVIAALRILFVQRLIESALVVAPASLLDQWRQELAKWAPELRAIIIRGSQMDRGWQWVAPVHVVIVSYETLRSDFTDNPQAPPRRKVWDVVIADEAQKIKNRNDTSDTLKALKRKRSWALTGTPLENNEDELASIIEFVDHGDLISQKHYSPGPELLFLHRELQLRRKKNEVLRDLPPKLTTKLCITLLPKQAQSYQRAEQQGIVHLRELGTEVRVQHVLELISRLKQICNADPETGESSKFEDIRQRLETLTQQNHRAIIFSQYTSDDFGVEGISKALQDFHPLSFTGDLSQEQRRSVIQRFKTDENYKALILSLRAGGVGLNLQEASYVFHLDRWWNPAIERQAEDRSHRFLQTVPVNVFKYTCIGTIEERIDKLLEQKQDLFDRLVDDVSVDVSAALTSGELFGLFGLEVPLQARREYPRRSTGLDLEDRCAQILERRGWKVERTPRSRDGGVDVIGSRNDEVGIEQLIYIQCKDHVHPVGVQLVREFIGSLPTGVNVYAVLAAPAGLTSDAQQLAQDRGVIVWGEGKLSELEGDN